MVREIHIRFFSQEKNGRPKGRENGFSGFFDWPREYQILGGLGFFRFAVPSSQRFRKKRAFGNRKFVAEDLLKIIDVFKILG